MHACVVFLYFAVKYVWPSVDTCTITPDNYQHVYVLQSALERMIRVEAQSL